MTAVSIQTNDVFHNDAVINAEDKNKLVGSKLWYLVLHYWLLTERKTKLIDVYIDQRFPHQMACFMVGEHGLYTAALTVSGEKRKLKYRVITPDNLTSRWKPWVMQTHDYFIRDWSCQCDSGRPGVLLKKMNDSKDYLMQWVALDRIDRTFLHAKMDMILDLVNRANISPPKFSFDHALYEEIFQLIGTVVDGRQIDLSTIRKTLAAYDSHRKEVKLWETQINKLRTMFTTDKWIMINDVRGGFLLGALSKEQFMAKIDFYKEHKSWTAPNNPVIYKNNEFLLPMKWYPSIEAVPEDIREPFLGSLAMFQTVSGVQDILKYRVVENVRDDKFHMNPIVYENIEAVSFFVGNSGAVLLLSK